jgi:phage terminase small subunit
MTLTKKQETFCQQVIIQDTYSSAYRLAYDCSKSTHETVNVNASKLMSDTNIIQRVKELKSKVESKVLYTVEKSIKRDLNLIKMYEDALFILSNEKSNDVEITTAERTIKFIMVSGYNSAQERLAKQHGFYEEHNRQRGTLKVREKVNINFTNKR